MPIILNMGYSIDAKYTLDLVKNQKAFNFIESQYFATGFILASKLNEYVLEAILNKWSEIDFFTSNRIRFLFHIENETTLTSWPKKPRFTESGYKHYHNKLLAVANRHAFQFHVKEKPYSELNNYGKDWYPQESILRLAQSMGISGQMPCLIWTVCNKPGSIFHFSLEGLSGNEIFETIKKFCSEFYDENAPLLNTIDFSESLIEKKLGSIQLTIDRFDHFSKHLKNVTTYRSLINDLKNLNWSYEWHTSLYALENIFNTLPKLDAVSSISNTFLDDFKSWLHKCKLIDGILRNEIKLENNTVPKVATALISAVMFDITLPQDAVALTIEKFNVGKKKLLNDFADVFSQINLLDGAEFTLKIKRRLKNLCEYCRDSYADTTSNLILDKETLVCFANILITIEGLSKVADLTISQKEYFSNIREIVRDFFYRASSANGTTIQFWLHYHYIEVLKNAEHSVQTLIGDTIIGEIDVTEIRKLLDKVNELSVKLTFQALDKYSEKKLDVSRENYGYSADFKIDSTGTKIKDDSDSQLRKTIERNLKPIHLAIETLQSATSDCAEQQQLDKLDAKLKSLDLIYIEKADIIIEGSKHTINTTSTTEINMNSTNDTYITGQAGAVGPHSHAHNMNFQQIWQQVEKTIDLTTLANELSKFREGLQREASATEHYISIGEVASAEKAAKEGKGEDVFKHLKKAGVWIWDVATKIGIGVATAAAKTALGL